MTETETIDVEFEGVVYPYSLQKIQSTETKHRLTLTTLFKDDYDLFDLFYEYYKKEGIDHFYLYYNGIVSDQLREKFNKEDVTLIEWDFKYFNDSKTCTYVHHAQNGQIHHALYRFGKKETEYMIFCDFDEYIDISSSNKDHRIIDEINQTNADMYGFHNYWCKTLDEKVPSIFPQTIEIGRRHPFSERSKCIYRVESLDIIRIHEPVQFSIEHPVLLKKSEYMLLHFYHWTNKKRHSKDRRMEGTLHIEK
jgi:hypothetical protein